MYLHDDCRYECLDCQEKENKLNDVKYWLITLMDQLFGLEEFDLENIEYYLNELTYCVEMKPPKRDLVICKNEAKTEVNTMLDAWKNFNNHYLSTLTNLGA